MTFLQIPESQPEVIDIETAWLRHGPFGMWIVRACEPRKIVELGTHNGYSYFSFCQAVVEGNLSTECIAVDTWEGDEHAGYYDDSVFRNVTQLNQKYRSFSTLKRMSFDEALSDIEDGSVDLLHVDGRHFYDDVKEDFESWIPKLSDRAIVLFHDTEVYERNFGVHKYWQEISETRPSLSFLHQHGLGVLFWGENIPSGLIPLVSNLKNPDFTDIIRNYFSTRGDGVATKIEARKSAANLKSLQDHLQAVSDELSAKSRQYEQSEANVAFLQKTLRKERRTPFRQLKRKYAHKILRSLAESSLPVSQRTRTKWKKSAEKRNPKRNDLLANKQSPALILQHSYQDLLESWRQQRLNDATVISGLQKALADGPLISVVVPVYNPDPNLMLEMIESVRSQSYKNWELCIADDCSSDPEVRRVLSEVSQTDSRVKVCFRETNGHISIATNNAIDMAQGAWIAFADHDDLLDPDALLLVAKAISEDENLKIVYTDEDKIDENGVRFSPHFKPDFNRDLLYSLNYISHLGVYDAQLVKTAGALREGFEGAQDYDLLLRCIERIDSNQIHHIPKVLYTWRATLGSTAASRTAKPYAIEAGRLALEEHLNRMHASDLSAEATETPFIYKSSWPLIGSPLVSIIIPTRDHLPVLRVAVETIIEKTQYDNFEIIIVDNGSTEKTTLEWFKGIQTRDRRVRVIRDDRPFNYSALNNAAVAQCRGDIIALVNNDIEVLDGSWLTEMVSLAQRPDTGCVGAKLLYPDGRIQHAGVVIGMGGVAGHTHHLFPRDHYGYFGRLIVRQDYTAVTAACLVVRRDVFKEVGGLNETDLAVAFNDVDLCLKVHTAGYRNVWTPFATLIHHESISRGYEDTPEKKVRFAKEAEYMKNTWGTQSFADPSYNPNLTLDRADFSTKLII
ncbi:glycosyltransferase [Sagittula sp. SSi028]|uniref:glycosyltransferase n=1 Tax=Sagittula sp. SSi028 TaxID=3400636 RepID=UPI003AF4FD6B